ncbi:BatD family protein [Photobacterium lutimaris]|uniref:Protein BatD n=1 Tax=Photobacterium lutimaris TaxID=388278 RepID=A0A2T3IYV6_9GAMM|nr:BatD family protein [Photobacterium lutimaris]PSU33824.1 hypothetical protein C9I99_10655 [Photobacterium lutimaris]TDR76149.1 oxygen tolerance protein BatD [Photobacterium lutimaris]
MIRRIVLLLCSLAMTPAVMASDVRNHSSLDDLISLTAELKRDVVYPQTEAEYVLTVESRADVHFSRVNPPSGDAVTVRRAGQDHEYYFVGDDEFRISTYRFFLSTEQIGRLPLDGASLTHVAVNDDGTRRRVRNWSNPVILESRPIPDNYKGRWLPSSKVTLGQQWSTDASVFQVGDSITRTLTLSIDGSSIDSFPELSVDYPDNVNVYSEQPKFEAYGSGMSMTLRQVIVPRSEGLLEIPAIAIPWFDTGSNHMAVASIDGLGLNILPNQTQTLALQVTDTDETVDGDYWRYATLIVSVLWLVTLQRLYKAHKQLNGLKAKSMFTKADNSLRAALEQRDHQAVVRAWANAKPDVKKACSQLMDAYFASFYSTMPTDGERERIAVLARLKERRENVKTTNDFAQIEPGERLTS